MPRFTERNGVRVATAHFKMIIPEMMVVFVACAEKVSMHEAYLTCLKCTPRWGSDLSLVASVYQHGPNKGQGFTTLMFSDEVVDENVYTGAMPHVEGPKGAQ